MAKLKFKQATHDAYDNLNKKDAQKRKLANFNQSSKAMEYNTIVGKSNFQDFDNKENYDPKNILALFPKRHCINYNKPKHNCP